ncbi:putative secreted protein (Por secretion system target) [Ulvibacter sp. MAR_2010_11]|uniref:agmatine deiminase family protein n=1 Tax=Ulvibacter sp. MAR_2010_11 TaxID=1250229 RepID=UPI000C2C1343|nr:agmatine deiminase family protein [Ulvibacter sp. MAR_2010_11]PKA82681.1 putative secreted protein (Por secretion system target) [Ulvibacter sp. MAR_2010_11]
MKRFYHGLILVIIFVLFTPLAISQQKEVLPKGFTDTEKGLISEFQFTSSQFTPPPTGPVRAAAEWEEIEYLVITWESNFQNILRQIVAVGVEECKVIITTQNEASVSSYLTAGGIDLTNVIFMDEDWDSIWIRDYAGNTIYSDDVGELALTDWIYNRPRPNDNVMPSAHASLLGLPIYITDTAPNDLVNTGGNYMSDGMGNAFASNLILDENAPGNPYGVSAKTEADIDLIMHDYMGIQNFIKMETLPYDAIHHIDMHLKLLDEETLMVSQYPEGVADGPQIQENIEYVLNNFQSPFGTPYDIVWIPAPPSAGGQYPDNGGSYRTYSNAVFVNKSIIVPTYRPEVDDPALALWQEAMPGYNIVGIDVDNPGENLIALFGAIHCITHSIGVEEPLWIVHQPVDEANQNSTVAIDAMIKHISGVNNAKVLWREVGSGTFNETPMTFVSGDNWTANLSITSNNIEYYILAEANSGKVLARPIVAPDGFWTINVENLSVSEWAHNNISAPYPNPTYGNVSFKLNNIGGPIHVTIHNLLGQQLFETDIENGNGVINLDLNSNWKGTLFVTFEGDFGRVNKKIIKL